MLLRASFFVSVFIFIAGLYIKSNILLFISFIVLFICGAIRAVKYLKSFLFVLLFTSLFFISFIEATINVTKQYDIAILVTLGLFWVFSIVFISLCADKAVSKIGNELISKLSRVFLIVLAISVYMLDITKNDIENMQVLLKIIIISISILLIPSSFALIALDIKDYYETNIRDKRDARFSLKLLRHEIAKIAELFREKI